MNKLTADEIGKLKELGVVFAKGEFEPYLESHADTGGCLHDMMISWLIFSMIGLHSHVDR